MPLNISPLSRFSKIQTELMDFIGSWASVSADLASLHKPQHPLKDFTFAPAMLVRILHAALQQASLDPYGQSKGGCLRIQGGLARARQKRGDIGQVDLDLNLELSMELKRHEPRPFIVSTEWDICVYMLSISNSIC